MRPIEQRRQPQATEGEIITEAHGEGRCSVALFHLLNGSIYRVGRDDLRHTLSDLEAPYSISGPEGNTLSGGITLDVEERDSRRKPRDDTDISGEGRMRHPARTPTLERRQAE